MKVINISSEYIWLKMAFEKSKRLLCVKVNQKCVVIRVEQSWRKMIWINWLPNPDFLRVNYIDLNTLEHRAASWDRHLHKEDFNSNLMKQKKIKRKKRLPLPSTALDDRHSRSQLLRSSHLHSECHTRTPGHSLAFVVQVFYSPIRVVSHEIPGKRYRTTEI